MRPSRRVWARGLRLLSTAALAGLMLFGGWPAGLVCPARADSSLKVHQVDTRQWPKIKLYLFLTRGGEVVGNPDPERLRVTLDGRALGSGRLDLKPLNKTKEKIAVAVAVDTSRSMRGRPLEETRKALLVLYNKKGASDQAALVTFGDKVEVPCPLTTDQGEFAKAVKQMRALGDTTLLYDGISRALAVLKPDDLPALRFVVVVSDGKDEGSKLTLDEVVNLARDQSTPVTALGVVTGKSRASLPELAKLATLTGGEFRMARSAQEMLAIYTRLAAGMLKQQVLSLDSDLPRDGSLHALTLEYKDASGRELSTSLNLMAPQTGSQPVQASGPSPAAASPVPPQKEDWKLLLRRPLYWGPVLAAVVVLLLVWLSIRRRARRKKELARRRQSTLVQPVAHPRPPATHPPAAEFVLHESLSGQSHALTGGTINLGAHQDNGLVLGHPTVSNYHAELSKDGDRWLIKDLNSTNGTKVNEVRIQQPTYLQAGDVISLGRVELVFQAGMDRTMDKA